MDKEIKIKPGEIACPECKGIGTVDHWTSVDFHSKPRCETCYGEGKLDWIERIVGKEPDEYTKILNEWVSEAAAQMAEDIDKEILEDLLGTINQEKEQNIKGNEEAKYDNGVLSELLFHPIIKQKIKGKKD